jgi:hypothetical protein
MEPDKVLLVLKTGLDKATRAGAFTLDEAASLHNGVKLLNDYIEHYRELKKKHDSLVHENSRLKNMGDIVPDSPV